MSSNNAISLSYILATRNRLPFLKITLGKLLDAVGSDEEIVVVDGDSSDGTKEYLQGLFETGKIQQYISEPDKNQAHAWNKAMLMAKGTLIKKIIDDDVFYYPAIRECKNYMLQNPAVDVVISNDLSSTLINHQAITKLSRLTQFEGWKNGKAPSFTFGDVHMLIRKSALAYIGLYNTVYVMMDWEYSLRISYSQANIAYYTGYNALTVAHPHTVTSLKSNELVAGQGRRGNIFYEYAGDRAAISTWSKIKIYIGKKLYGKKAAQTAAEVFTGDINAVYDYYSNALAEANKPGNFTFLTKY